MVTNNGFNAGRIRSEDISRAIGMTDAGIALISDEPNQANELLQWHPNVTFIGREYWPNGDDNLHTKVTPEQWVAYMAGRGYHPDVYWNCGNEPTTNIDLLASWTAEAIERASSIGRKLVVGNFSLLNPPMLGLFNPWLTTLTLILKALEEYPEHRLGLHEYRWIDKPVAAGDPIGHYKVVHQACDMMNIKRPEIFITEYGMERMTPLGSWQSLGMSPKEVMDLAMPDFEMYAADGIPALWFRLGEWRDGAGNNYDVTPLLPEMSTRVFPEWSDTVVVNPPEPPDPEPEPEPEPEPQWHDQPFPISFHVSSVNIEETDYNYLKWYVQNVRPGTMTLHGGMAFAKQLVTWADEVGHDDFIIIYRHDPINQGEGTPQEIEHRGGIECLIKDFQHDVGGFFEKIYFNPFNEFSQDEESLVMVLDAIHIATEHNVRLSLCGFGQAQTRSIFFECEWGIDENGHARPLNHKPLFNAAGPIPGPWFAAVAEMQGTDHIWNFHVYWDFRNPAIVVEQGYNCPDAVCVYDPLKKIDPDVDDHWLYNYGNPFVGNPIALEQLFRMHGLTLGTVVSDESGPDSLNGMYKGYRDAHNESNFYPADLYHAHTVYVAMGILRASDGPYAQKMEINGEMKPLNSIYEKTGIDLFGFRVGPRKYHDVFWGFDVARFYDLLTLFKGTAERYHAMPGPIDGIELFGALLTVVIDNNLNVRSSPNVEPGNITDSLVGLEIYELLAGKAVSANGYDWLPINYKAAGIEGWVALARDFDGFVFSEVEYVIIDPPDPPDPPTGDYVTRAEFDTYQALNLTALTNISAALGDIEAAVVALEGEMSILAAEAIKQEMLPLKEVIKRVADSWYTYLGYSVEELTPEKFNTALNLIKVANQPVDTSG